MKTRILVALPITAIVIAAIFVQGWLLAVFAVCLALAAQFEIIRAFDSTNHKVVKPVSGLYAVILAALFLVDYAQDAASSMRWLDGATVLALLIAFAMTSFVVAMFTKAQSFDGVISTVFTMVYPSLFFVCLYSMILRCAGPPVSLEAWLWTALAMLMLFVPPVLSDTLAYFWGRKFGKTKLCPSISPNKTVAGSVAGLVGGAVGGVLVWLGISAGGAPTLELTGGLAAYLFMGAALAGVSQLGDLAASYMKRYVGIKDFGKLLPGHGGILDRIDSTMFTMPLVSLFVAAHIIELVPVA